MNKPLRLLRAAGAGALLCGLTLAAGAGLASATSPASIPPPVPTAPVIVPIGGASGPTATMGFQMAVTGHAGANTVDGSASGHATFRAGPALVDSVDGRTSGSLEASPGAVSAVASGGASGLPVSALLSGNTVGTAIASLASGPSGDVGASGHVRADVTTSPSASTGTASVTSHASSGFTSPTGRAERDQQPVGRIRGSGFGQRAVRRALIGRSA